LAQESAGNQPSHIVNQGVGLLVFVGGVALLALVFLWAYHLYQDLDLNAFPVRTASVRAEVPRVGATPLPAGTNTATPQPAQPITAIAAKFVGKLLLLLAMGWIGALIASKGIGLAVGPARAPQRTAD
jgi:hypothetical protein